MATTIPDSTPPVAPYLSIGSTFKSLKNPQVTFVTSLGNIVLDLNALSAPITVANMLSYVESGFYNGTIFHRVIPNFVVQGGGLTAGMVAKATPYDPIVIESNNGLSNLRGTVAMARTSLANSATSQFFVNLVDNTGLDYKSQASPGYAVFGSVISGMAIIDSMAKVPTVNLSINYQNVPQTDINILSAIESQVGQSISKSGVVNVSDIEQGAKWDYSLNGGATWIKGSKTSFTLKEGIYTEDTILVRQTDAAGNLSKQGQAIGVLTVDRTPPVATTFSPTNGQKAAEVNANIVIAFNERIQLGTGTITLKTMAGKVIESFDVTPSSSSSTSLTINPVNDLAYNTSHTLTITSGSIVDIAGNAFAGTKTYKFTTTDTVSTASASFTLSNDVNKLKYIGTSNFTGNGNGADNVITAGTGNDKLNGGLGKDTLIGAGGADTFTFNTALNKNNIDTLSDFVSGQDKIALDDLIFQQLLGMTDLTNSFVVGTTAKDANDFLIYNKSKGALFYDADGNGKGAAIQFATLTGQATLNAADFLVV